ncbi:hypothetical protein AC1031_003478 [Aphanomyces cochlioides]|nr:hypothetical protein AC1031_003478 [Aphanomyces cochlioides]
MALSASWTRGLEAAFVSAVSDATKNPRFVASTGKNLRAAGWNSVLAQVSPKEPSIKTIDQLKSKWKRLKADYTDYHFLVGLSGFGDGFDDEKWRELDAGRNEENDGTIDENDDNESVLDNVRQVDRSVGDFARAQKRAKILYDLKKNRKRKISEEEKEVKQARRDIADAIQGIHKALNRLVDAYVEKRGNEHDYM